MKRNAALTRVFKECNTSERSNNEDDQRGEPDHQELPNVFERRHELIIVIRVNEVR